MIALNEVAERVASDAWGAWQEAVGVLDGGKPAPESWAAEIEAGVQAFIDSERVERPRRIANDLFIFATHTGREMEPGGATGADLEAWKRATPGWRQQMAEWRKHRANHADDSLVRENAPAIVRRRLARAKAEALDREIDKAVRAAITARGVVVRAALKGIDLRVIEVPELQVAILGIMTGELTIDGIMFSRVRVELPGDADIVEGEAPMRTEGGSAEGEAPDRADPLPPRPLRMDEAMADWFRDPEGGGLHRNSTNRAVVRAFKAAKSEYRSRKVTKTSIAAARKMVGWGPRGRGSAQVVTSR